MKQFYAVLTLMILVAVSPALDAGDHAARAGAILDSLGRPVGLVHLPRCGDGELALALLAADDRLMVHGQDADYAAVQNARRKADEAGDGGRRAWFDHGGLSRLLPVGNSADLIVMTDLLEADLTPELAREIARVLHPWYGVALLGGPVTHEVMDRKAREAMDRWSALFEGLGLRARVIDNRTVRVDDEELAAAFPGVLLRVEKPALPGADNWSHYWHGPGNNPVSTDTAYSTPETIQWTGMPRLTTKTDLPIVADGRLFMLWNGHVAGCYSAGDPVLPGEEVELPSHGWATSGLDVHVNKDEGSRLMQVRGPLLEVRAAGSGARLWHRRMSPMMWMQHQRSVIVADGDRLIVGDGNTLRVLDQATGEERLSRELDDEEIKWIAVADGYIALLSGPTIDRFPERMRRNTGGVRRSRGRLLTVLDGESLETLWEVHREQGPDEFDPRSAAIDNGMLFIATEGSGEEVISQTEARRRELDEAQLLSEGIRAEAYRLADGALQWQQTTDIERRLYTVQYEDDTMLRHPVVGYAMAGLYIISASEDDRVVMLSQESGELVRTENQAAGRKMRCFMYYMDCIWGGGREGRDPVTGEVKLRASASVGGCGHLTAAPQGIIGQPGLTWDAATQSSVEFVLSKSQCAASSFVANGLIWRLPNYKGADWRGFVVRAAAERELPPPGPRLVRTAEPASPPAEEAADGWKTHRVDATRSSSAAVSVADTATLLWSVAARRPTQLQPAGGPLIGPVITPVPPVTRGDVVIAADNDGVVQALELQTGDIRWRTQTGGRIENSPTIWKDRVFVGSTDGWVYAFGLADGRELWRLRVAPEAGRMTLYDQLGSRWPVLASPLVVDGKLFAVAGALEAIDGVFAVAADAETGELLWEHAGWRDSEGEYLNPELMSSGSGQLCWDAETGEVVFSPEAGLPVRFAANTGSARAAFLQGQIAELQSLRREWKLSFWEGHGLLRAGGQEIGKFDPDWIVRGGWFLHQGNDGQGGLPILNAAGAGMPSWDDTGVLLTFATGRHSPRAVVMIPKARLMEFLASQIADAAPEKFRMDANIFEHVEALGGWSTELDDKWRFPHTRVLTPIVALVLTSHQRGKPKLIAFNRADGTVLWEQRLPANAIRNGLAVAADGSIILALEDGQILRLGAEE